MGNIQVDKIKRDYEKLCNDYVDAMLAMWDCGSRDNVEYYWVADEIGGVFMVGDVVNLNMDEIRYVVDNQVSFEQVALWQDYYLRCHNLGLSVLNLQSWCKGAPRYNDGTLSRLEGMKRELELMIRDAKMEEVF